MMLVNLKIYYDRTSSNEVEIAMTPEEYGFLKYLEGILEVKCDATIGVRIVKEDK